MFTVITRTSGRPRFFAECRRSVLEQTIRPFHLVGTDDPADTYPEGDLVVKLPPRRGRVSNLHFNDLITCVPDTHPFVVLLDDDDVFTSKDSLKTIYENIQTAAHNLRVDVNSGLVSCMYKMRRLDHTIPTSLEVFLPPKFGNCTGGGICFHKKTWKPWDAESGADYRFITHLFNTTPIYCIDEVLTAMQSGPGGGMRKDLM